MEITSSDDEYWTSHYSATIKVKKNIFLIILSIRIHPSTHPVNKEKFIHKTTIKRCKWKTNQAHLFWKKKQRLYLMHGVNAISAHDIRIIKRLCQDIRARNEVFYLYNIDKKKEKNDFFLNR